MKLKIRYLYTDNEDTYPDRSESLIQNTKAIVLLLYNMYILKDMFNTIQICIK